MTVPYLVDPEPAAFLPWVTSRTVAVDTETTGLEIWRRDWSCTTVQVADDRRACILHPDRGENRVMLRTALEAADRLVFHNAAYDVPVLARVLGEDIVPTVLAKYRDTRLMAHLLDPRAQSEGGIGHGLKALVAHYVDPSLVDGEARLKEHFRRQGWRVGEGFARIDPDDPLLLEYGATDAVMTRRLFDRLEPVVAASRLYEFEHRVQAVTIRMMLRGIKLDIGYAEGLREHYLAEEAVALEEAARLGVENVHSPRQVAAVLEALGAELTERTPSDQPKVDRAVLEALVERGGPAGEVASAVHRAKQARKFLTAYVDRCLDVRDLWGRVHPIINSLQARTARMSISDPPLQQLPSGDWRIRRMFVADPDQALVAVDYSQVELRILAALARERKMIDAFGAGLDIHDVTARILFGAEFTKAQRRLAKGVGFGRVYGGGATTLARVAGVDMPTAKRAIARYDDGYPGVKAYARRLTDSVEWGRTSVTTPSGRKLPLDRDRAYAAVNYVVQSTARDVLAQALLDLEAAGLDEHLLLPVHDEVIAQGPADQAKELAVTIAEKMTMPLDGVRLVAEPEVLGPSWGHGYGAVA